MPEKQDQEQTFYRKKNRGTKQTLKLKKIVLQIGYYYSIHIILCERSDDFYEVWFSVIIIKQKIQKILQH